MHARLGGAARGEPQRAGPGRGEKESPRVLGRARGEGEPPRAGPAREKGAGQGRRPHGAAVRAPPVLLAGGSAQGLRTGDKEFRQRVFSH